MTKVLFVMTSLRNGGITSSLLNLLDIISNDKNLDIDILLFDRELRGKLPLNVRVLPENKYLKLPVVSQKHINKESYILGIFRIFLGLLTKVFGNYVAYKFLMMTCPKIGEYDYAFSCTQSAPLRRLYGGCNEFVLNKVNARRKITFLHCDYKNYGINTKYSSKLYSEFDKIAAVSEGVKETFLKEEPALFDKVFVVHNCHNFHKIKLMAEQNPVIYDNRVLNFLTVARIAPEKGHMRLLNVFCELREKGYNFCWHIVGGADAYTENMFKEMITKKGLSDSVKMYYDTDNPYRFFSNADAFILPSYHEAAAMVFSEAECLCLPIITTNTISAKEFVSDKNIGIVCSNNSEDLNKVLENVLKKPEILKQIKVNMKNKSEPTNENAVKEFYKLIDTN